MSRLVRRSSLLGALLAVGLAGPALAASPVSGSGDDPGGDAAAGGPDIVSARAALDGAGGFAGTLTFATAPSASADGIGIVAVGRRDAQGACQPLAAVGGTLSSQDASGWYRYSGGELTRAGDVTRSSDGTSVTFVAASSELADLGADCAAAQSGTTGGTTADETAEFALAAAAAPPATTSTTTPAPTPTTTTPAPTPTPTPAPTPAPTPTPSPTPTPTATTTTTTPPRSGAHLELRLPTVPSRGKRGVTRTLKLTVRNRGTKTATRPVVRVTPPRGVTASPRRVTLASIKRGRSRTVTLRVKVTSKAKAASTIGVSVRTRSKGTAASAAGRLALPIKRPAATTPGGSGTTPGGGTTTPGSGGSAGGGSTPQPANPLVGKAYNSFVPDGLGGTRTDGLYFQDGTWAVRGTLDGSIPTCTARTADADGRGCVPYTYDAASKALTIDGKPATYKPESEGVELDGTTFGYFPLVPAGTPLQTDASYVSCVGFAPYATCSTGQFIARPDGTFQTQGSASSSNPSGDVTAIGNDQKGTYAVEAPGILRLTYADGHVVVRVIQYFRDGTSGETNPTTRGLLLDGSLYTVD